MFKIKGLDHIVLKTANTSKMLHFYCDILGCDIEKTQKEINLTQLRAGESILDIIADPSYQPNLHKNLEHFCFRVSNFNFEAMQQYFLKHGIELHRYGKRYGAEGYGYSFYLFDPDGNELELKESTSIYTSFT